MPGFITCMSRTSKLKLIGRREFVSIPQLGIEKWEAKIDTGAYTSSLHCENINLCDENGKPVLYFSIASPNPAAGDLRQFRFEEFTEKKIRNSFGEMEQRFVIRTVVHIGRKKIRSSISLSNRDLMRYPLLIGRRLISGKFLVDVDRIHTGGVSIKKKLQRGNTPHSHENSSFIKK